MSPMRPVGVQQPDSTNESVIKAWLEALATGSCDASSFLLAMQEKFKSDPEGNWEVLSQLDQYYRRGRIETEAFKTIKTALAESALGVADVPPRSDTVDSRPTPESRAKPEPRDIPDPRDIPTARDVPGARDIPVARDAVFPGRAEQTDAFPRRDDAPAPDAFSEPKPGSVLRRRYRLETVIGQGSMGNVFQALDEFRLEAPPGTQRLAVKVVHSAVAKRADLLAELRREFQNLQLLSHPNIVRVFEFDRDGPVVFFTMELLNGALLSRVLQARRLVPMDRLQALAVIRDIGAAIAYAHSRGVVHGEICPQNIFFAGSGELRVLGFGGSPNARRSPAASDHELALPLTASGYASCQVLEGERADARDDVFALACLAYVLLSGQHPFAKRTALEARQARLNVQRPANLSNQQWQTLRTGLRWERDGRPADLQAWIERLHLRGAAKRVAPLSDLLEAPPQKSSKSRNASAIAAAVALLLAAAYWVSSQRGTLPSVDPGATPPAPAASTPETPNSPPPNSPSAGPQTVSPTAPSGQLAAAAPQASPPAVERARPPTADLSSPSAPLAASPETPAARTPAAAPAAVPATSPPAKASPVALPASAPAPAGPSKVELAADAVDVPSGESSALVTVRRKGSLRGGTDFTWWTESGTAKPGADFSAVVPQVASIGDGKSAVALNIPLSKAPHAQAKSFYVVIDHTEGGAALGARTLTMVTLLPSD
jgi:serine/threonine protein kinase